MANEANKRKRDALNALLIAFEALRDAQNNISDIEGHGSVDLYDQIAVAYNNVWRIRETLTAMKPTGVFEC